MSIRSSFERENKKDITFTEKSYSNIKFNYSELDLDKYLKNGSDVSKRISSREYRIDHAKKAFKLVNESGIITVTQLRDLFNDIGFNMDVSFGETHEADISGIQNIGGYIVPFWEKIALFLSKITGKSSTLFTLQLGPGKSRIHCRFYHESDGSWIVITHIDLSNWFNILNLKDSFRSHAIQGTGNYEKGFGVMNIVLEHLRIQLQKKTIKVIDCDTIIDQLENS